MRSVLRAACALVIFAVFGVMVVNAQLTTSTLMGHVLDPEGRGIPQASVTVTNTGTGISTTGTSSQAGSYSISGLVPGTYSVQVKAPGFSTFVQQDVVIHASTAFRLDAKLQVGSTQQTVQVTTAPPLLQTDSPAISTTLNEQQIRALPSGVQSVGGLIPTVAGSNPEPPGGSFANPNLSGSAHWGGNNFLVDGVSVDDLTNGGGAYAYGGTNYFSTTIDLINQPPLDTLQEFRVVDVNPNAEFRNSGTIIMVTKSGTNKFHGDLYEFFQNSDLNANTYLQNASKLPRSKANLNQFGGSIGGPILKNKLFFFFAPSFYRQLQSNLAQLNLPSMAMRKGDFSAMEQLDHTQLYNPYTGQPFPNNQIPSSMIAPQAEALLKYLPVPTIADSPGIPNEVVNYRAEVPQKNYANNYTLRIDYQIRPSDRIFGEYRQANSNPWNVFLGGPPQYGNATNFGFDDKTVAVSETHTFSSTALNDFHVSWYLHGGHRNGQNTNFNPASLFPQLTPGTNRGLPSMGASGYSLFHDYGGVGTYGNLYNLQFVDNFTKVIGNHSIKIGFNELGVRNFSKNGTGSLGSFSFSGAWTGNQGWPGTARSEGNSFADFLLGTANAASTSGILANQQATNRIYSAYAQDTWQALPYLTLNYGIRYMYQTVWHVKDNARAFFDAKNNKIALPQNSATPTLPKGGNPVLFNAYRQYFETTQSIGMPVNYMHPDKADWGPRIGFALRPFKNTVLRGGYGIFYNFLIQDFGAWGFLNPPFGANSVTNSSLRPGNPTTPYLPDVTFANPFENTHPDVSAHPTLYADQPDIKNPMIQQYSLTLEHQFFTNWVARASYVGSVTHQLTWFEMNINQPAVQIPNTPGQEQAPYQPWGGILANRDGAILNFNQLQLEAKRRYANGISLDLNYSWTRSLDDVEDFGGPQQIHHPTLDYGNTSSLPSQVLTGTFLYALPIGRGRRFLGSAHGITNAIIGGWQASGIVTYASGTPFSVYFAIPNGFTGWAGGRANRIPGVPVYIRNHGHNVLKGVPWFNPKAFGPPKPWTWGNSARNSLWGPGMYNWDLSGMKHVTAPGDRFQVTLRADFFDATNHFNPGNPDALVASPQYGGLPIPQSGLIFGGSGNRVIQFGLRTSF